MRSVPFLLLVSLLAVALLALPTSADNGGLKIAVVDLQRALNEVDEGKRAIAQIEGFAKAKQSDIAKKEDEVKAKSTALEQQGPMRDPDSRAKMEQELQSLILEYQQLTFEANTEMQQMELEMRGKILEKLSTSAERLAKQRGYQLLLEAGGVVYAEGAFDITAALIEAYSAGR